MKAKHRGHEIETLVHQGTYYNYIEGPLVSGSGKLIHRSHTQALNEAKQRIDNAEKLSPEHQKQKAEERANIYATAQANRDARLARRANMTDAERLAEDNAQESDMRQVWSRVGR